MKFGNLLHLHLLSYSVCFSWRHNWVNFFCVGSLLVSAFSLLCTIRCTVAAAFWKAAVWKGAERAALQTCTHMHCVCIRPSPGGYRSSRRHAECFCKTRSVWGKTFFPFFLLFFFFFSRWVCKCFVRSGLHPEVLQCGNRWAELLAAKPLWSMNGTRPKEEHLSVRTLPALIL